MLVDCGGGEGGGAGVCGDLGEAGGCDGLVELLVCMFGGGRMGLRTKVEMVAIVAVRTGNRFEGFNLSDLAW